MKVFLRSSKQGIIFGEIRGFALICCVMIMSLFAMLCVGMLRFATIEMKQVSASLVEAEARANTRLALIMAIGQLQDATGADQVVTSRADVLSNDRIIYHKNWVGAWRTTYEEGGTEWPLIGQKTDLGNDVYDYEGAYSDLRQTVSSLDNGKWREELFNGWLVSSLNDSFDPAIALDLVDEGVIEMLGKGTLGQSVLNADYVANRVLVQKVDVAGDGAVAWWTADNNQKANIKPYELSVSENEVATNPGESLKFVKQGSSYLFQGFQTAALRDKGKIFSSGSSHLISGATLATKESLGRLTHDLTYHSPSMFINTGFGGFQRDLTPLLFANKNDKTVEFTAPTIRVSSRVFSSEYPMIASKYHDVLAPTFSALRYWGLQRYDAGNGINTNLSRSASRLRSGVNWPYNQSDGVTFESAEWAAEMPKTHPIMTDCRWHYYFSVNGNRIRTHIIPRVCLWNPYNREIKTTELVVMMPNPYYVDPDTLSSGVKTAGHHFFVEADEVERMKRDYPDDSAIQGWGEAEAKPLGLQFKIRYGVRDSTQGFIFPNRRYLAFTLQGATLFPGECHVFSPKITSLSISTDGARIAAYERDDVSQNVLSSDAIQGKDHFYYDMVVSELQVRVPTSSKWDTVSKEAENGLDLLQIHDYRSEKGPVEENFPFILKASNGRIPLLGSLLTSESHPTLQLVNNGCGGVAASSYFAYSGESWGSANIISNYQFGNLDLYTVDKDAPATHQIGAKLLWLDESTTEGNLAPLRYGNASTTRWTSEHMVYHPASIANWNVRAQLTSRSPIAQCADRWYLYSTGPWMVQFIPKTPKDVNDSPQLNSTGTAFIKNPLGLAVNHSISPNVVLFDLPHRDHGIHSLAAMRHAMISPYSWHPSYIIGHSLRDPHAPADTTVHPEVVSYMDSDGVNHWDYYIGALKKPEVNHGAYAKVVDSQDLLQVGGSAVTRSFGSVSLTSSDDVLPYDIAFEVNQGLWDNYFISSLPLIAGTDKFSSIIPVNQRNQRNSASDVSITELIENLTVAGNAVDIGFWLNGYYYRRENAFNLNSTSVPAWTAFLSGTLGINREMSNGSMFNNGLAGFARYRKPIGLADADQLDPEKSDAWKGLRTLSEEEIELLAIAVVAEVKLRGPFISISDFVNRRLTDRDDESSRMGALDAAILAAGLNQSFYSDGTYHTTSVIKGSDSRSEDSNHDLFKDEYLYASGGFLTSYAVTKTWGLPSFLMQSDILEPLAPALTTRGDTFTIRAYGESKRDGKVVASAYAEAIVERSPHYVEHQKIGSAAFDGRANIPTDRALKMDPFTGDITSGYLTATNERLGRKYLIKSFRWLNKDEI